MAHGYPNIEQVEKATREQLASWYRFLPIVSNDYEIEVMNRIVDRFSELGGMSPEISKKLGWDK